MKIGLYFDLRVPADSGLDPARVYAHTLEMCEEAERAGLDSVWFSEHHGFDDGYLPQPMVMAAAAAARTSRVRVGTAIVVAPLHRTVELAEQAAVVDLVSDGRLDLGVGAGYRAPEFALFEADRDQRWKTLARQVEDLHRLWRDGTVTPAPVQDPLPVWMGSGGPVGARRAGRLGANLLWVNPALVEPYRRGRTEAGLDPDGGAMGGPLFAWASEDPEAEWARVRPFIEYQQNSYRRHMVQGLDVPAPRPYDADAGRKGDMTRPGTFWCETPEDIAGRVKTWIGDAKVDVIFLWASVGGMPESMVERNVDMIATRLAPLLRPLGGGPTEEKTHA